MWVREEPSTLDIKTERETRRQEMSEWPVRGREVERRKGRQAREPCPWNLQDVDRGPGQEKMK